MSEIIKKTRGRPRSLTPAIRRPKKPKTHAIPHSELAPLHDEFNFTLQTGVYTPVPFLTNFHKGDYKGWQKWWRGERVLCTPPGGYQTAAWISKCYYEVLTGGCPLAVLLLSREQVGSDGWNTHIEAVRDHRQLSHPLAITTRHVPGHVRMVKQSVVDGILHEENTSNSEALTVVIFRLREQHEMGHFTNSGTVVHSPWEEGDE